MCHNVSRHRWRLLEWLHWLGYNALFGHITDRPVTVNQWWWYFLKTETEQTCRVVSLYQQGKGEGLRCCRSTCILDFIRLFNKNIVLHTLVFSASGLLAARTMIWLFCWHMWQRSVIGFITVSKGQYFLQIMVKVEYFTALTFSALDEASRYFCHTEYLVVLDGRSWHLLSL